MSKSRYQVPEAEDEGIKSDPSIKSVNDLVAADRAQGELKTAKSVLDERLPSAKERIQRMAERDSKSKGAKPATEQTPLSQSPEKVSKPKAKRGFFCGRDTTEPTPPTQYSSISGKKR